MSQPTLKMSREAVEALTASVSKCSVRQADLWTLVGDCIRLGDDYEAVHRMCPTLGECRIIIHQYHQVRAMIIGALSQLRVEQGHRHGDDPVSLIVLQGPEFVEAFIKSPRTLLAMDIVDSDDSVDGFLVYALAEHAWRCFGVEFM
jgi:hypothetical protein